MFLWESIKSWSDATPTDESSLLLDAASRKFDLEIDLRMRRTARKMSKLVTKSKAFPAPIPGTKQQEARQLILNDIQMLKNSEDSMLKSACLVHKLDGAAKMSITKIQAVVAANAVSKIAANTEQPPGNSLTNAIRDHANNARMDDIMSQIDTVSSLNDDDDHDDDSNNDIAVAALRVGLPSIPTHSMRRNNAHVTDRIHA